MRSALLILPFLALLVGAVSTAIGSSFPQAGWIAPLGWGLAAAIVILWVVLDLDNFYAFAARKGTKYGASSGIVMILAILVIIGFAVVSSRPRFNKSYDVTKGKLNTLSDQSMKIVQKIKDQKAELKITAFFQDEQVQQEFRDLMRLYQSRGADFAPEYLDPQKEPTRAMAEKLTAGNTVIVRLGDRESRLTAFNEEKFTNALVNVLKESSKKIYFTKGHGEGEIKSTEGQGFRTVVTELENNKYSIAELSLLETLKVPNDANLVVIAGPQYDFRKKELDILEEYLKNGGAMLVMVDATVPVDALNKLLEKFGMKYNQDLLVLKPDDPRAVLLGQNNAIVSEFDSFSPVTKDFANQAGVALLFSTTRSITDVPENTYSMKITQAAKTANVIIRIKDVKSKRDLGKIDPARVETGTAFPVIDVAVGQVTAQGTAKEDSGEAKDDSAKKEIRIVVTGSSQFARNGGSQAAEHRDMFVNIANYLLQDEDFISIRPKDLEKSTIRLASSWSQLSLLVLSFIYPFVFLGGGVVYWFRRRRA